MSKDNFIAAKQAIDALAENKDFDNLRQIAQHAINELFSISDSFRLNLPSNISLNHVGDENG